MSRAGLPVRSLPAPYSPTQLVARGVVAELQRAGIDTLFGIPGGTIAPVFHAARHLHRVHAVHEGMAGYQALGWARSRHRPGTVVVTSGPGLLNLATAVAAAREDEVPMLVLAGEVASHRVGQGALQDGREDGLGVLEVFRPLAKFAGRADRAEDVLPLIRDALRIAQTAPRGPVVLALPRDLLDEEVAVAQVPDAAGIDTARPTAIPDHIARALGASERPVIWLGVGARSSGAAAAARGLAERHRVPVVADLEAKGVFPESHPLCMGVAGPGSDGRAATVLEEADLVLAVGARLDPTSLAGVHIEGSIVHIEHATRRGSRFGCGLCADLPAALARVAATAPLNPSKLLARDRWARSFPAPVSPIAPLDRAPHEPGAVVRSLQRHLPTARFTSDIGNHLLAASRHLRIDEPDGFFVSHGLAGMTSGIGSAMGMAFADPSRPVVGICGDGGMLMAGGELATMARHRLNLVLAVFEDGAWGMVRDGMTADFGTCEDAALPDVDLVALARSLGLDAKRVNDARHLGRALRERRSGPLLLVFPVERCRESNPRLDPS